MNIDQALTAKLKSDAGITATVVARIYPRKAPQGATLPCIVYHHHAHVREHTHSGPSGLATSRFTIDCLAKTLADAKALATAVRQLIDGTRGEWGGTGGTGVFVDGCFVEDQADEYVDDLDLYVDALDVRVQHVEWPATTPAA